MGLYRRYLTLAAGKAVVVRHGKYFTAYSNLSGISVNKGQEIRLANCWANLFAGLNGEGQIIFMVQNDKGITLTQRWLKPR